MPKRKPICPVCRTDVSNVELLRVSPVKYAGHRFVCPDCARKPLHLTDARLTALKESGAVVVARSRETFTALNQRIPDSATMHEAQQPIEYVAEFGDRVGGKYATSNRTIGYKQLHDPGIVTVSPTGRRVKFAPGSDLDSLQCMIELPMCPVCSLWGGMQQKVLGRMICSKHQPQRPDRFRCPMCAAEYESEGTCQDCNVALLPHWRRMPRWLRMTTDPAYPGTWEHFRSARTGWEGWKRPTIDAMLYAQMRQRGATVRGLDAIARVCQQLGILESEILEEAQDLDKQVRAFRQQIIQARPPEVFLGITGTRTGMTEQQQQVFLNLLREIRPVEFHHGDCVGADSEAHHIVRDYAPGVKIIIHPPSNPRLRAFCQGDEYRPVADYLERNRQLVDEITHLAVTPATAHEVLRSGTWAAYRYAESLTDREDLDILLIEP